ncbi:MAG: helix-turn-helix domain-containing protein, partial [Desulfomonilaceae bacterium]
LSLSKLSEITGIAASNLSSIELNKTSPTLSTLAKIADGLEQKIEQFLNNIFYHKVLICQLNDSRRTKNLCTGVNERLITADAVFNRIEVKALDFNVGAGPIAAPVYNSDRFILILKGEILLAVDDKNIAIHEGQGAYLAPDAEVKMANAGKTLAKALVIHTTT